MREGGKIDLKNLIAGGVKAVEKKLREGAGALPVVTVGEKELPEAAPIVETKAGDAPVSSGETVEQALQTFVKSISDGSVICLINKEGTAKNYYMRVGNELHSGKNGKGKDATAKAFGQKNNDWKVVPVENGVSVKKSTVSAESGVVPTMVGAQVEKTAKPEAPADLQRALDNLWEEISTIIDAISTPEEYAAFRKGMNIVLTEDGQVEKRYFFQMRVVEKLTGRKVEKEENLFVATLTRALEEKTREKFRALKEADLQMQYDREQAKIDEAKELALVELKKDWERKLNIALPWEEKDIFDNLSPIEQGIVKKDYRDCANALSQNLQEKLNKPRIEIKNKFNDVVREKRRSAKGLLGDSSDETLQGKYADYIRRLNQLGQGADAAFERNDIDELNRALRAVNEVKFVVKEEKKKDTQPVTPEKMKELEDEELFAILVEALHSKRKPFGKNKEGKELIIEDKDISPTEIKYHYGGMEVVAKPKYVKKFLQFLQENFSWVPRKLRTERNVPLSEEAKEAEKIMVELKETIRKKKTSFSVDGSVVSASSKALSQNGAYLNGIVEKAQEALDAGDIEYLRGMLKKANEAVFKQEEPTEKKAVDSKSVVPVAKDKVANKKNTLRGVAMKPVSVDNIFDSNPFEGLNDSEEEQGQTEEEPMTPEEERYEELGILLEYTEYWSIFGVVADALERVSAYSRKTGKLKGDIIDEMGGMDLAAEKILMEAIQKVLPSGWSKDDKEFYSRKSALEFLDLFVEEDEEDTEK